ncbi:MAG: hypothetical protein K0B10_13710 [Vicingaceae bacterium]|nr:hypothetical protein [Vicingaceae bacterium]
MNNIEPKHEWTKKDGVLSDKTAFIEFGLTRKDIINAINEGKLHFREGSIYGNPYLRLLRSQVEKLVEEKFGKNFLIASKAKRELKNINKELKELKLKVEQLEEQKNKLNLILKENH